MEENQGNTSKPEKISDEAYWKQKCAEGRQYKNPHATGGAIYGLGLIGAAVYFISNAVGFGAGVVGFLKALVWPAFLVYEALNYMGA